MEITQKCESKIWQLHRIFIAHALSWFAPELMDMPLYSGLHVGLKQLLCRATRMPLNMDNIETRADSRVDLAM